MAHAYGMQICSSRYGWTLACFLSNTISWEVYELWHYGEKRKFMKVMLRSFGVSVQESVLSKQQHHPHWRSCI